MLFNILLYEIPLILYCVEFPLRLVSRDDIVILDSLNYIKGINISVKVLVMLENLLQNWDCDD